MTSQKKAASRQSQEKVKIEGLNKPVVLIGLMGAGKSTIGRRLAKRMGWKFADSDSEIVDAAGCSISDIFAIHGEQIFRDLEERVITRLLSQDKMVMATGGGAWMQAKVREQIQESAISVWLHAELDVLLARVTKRNNRPLLETGDKRAILQKLMEERYPVYGQADITVESGDGPHENVVERVLDALKGHVAA
ncbi:MAG: shikimate kinase [Rickettsiales bacterium]|nr:shikimate kinase [Rickettsiales bacterium]|tara:strand:+ start:645 stop:1223 length:579 start_codon:yes stop_codon:yes gene_type:complete